MAEVTGRQYDYFDSVEQGQKDCAESHGNNPDLVPNPLEASLIKLNGYWIARHAARQVAVALLAEAKDVGVTGRELAALERVAAQLAYD